MPSWYKNLSSRSKAAAVIIVGAIIALAVILFITLNQEEVYVQPPEVVKPNDPKDVPKTGPDGGRLGGVLVSPSTQSLDNVSTGSKIDPVTIENNANVRVGVEVDYVPMRGNSLAGAPEYDVTPETIRAGRKDIRPDIRRFILMPGAEKTVGATIVGQPRNGNRGLYGVLVFKTDSLRENETSQEFKGGVRLQLNQTYSIGAIVLAQFAGPVKKDFKLQQVRIKQDDDNDYQMQVRVRNDGDSIESTNGQVLISNNATGQVVKTVPLSERQGIFPGDNRDLIGSKGGWRLPAGEYTATARVAGQERSWAFRINEQGNLPLPEGVFELVVDPGRPLPNQGFQANVQVLNTGEVGLQASGEALLYRYGVDKVLQRQRVQINSIGPDDIGSQSVDFQGLPEEGTYELVLELDTAEGISLGQKAQNIVVDDRQVETPGAYDRFRDWMSANPLLTLVAGAAILALITGLVLGFISWRRRRAER